MTFLAFILTFFLLVYPLITGRVRGRTLRGWFNTATRESDPQTFWITIGIYAVIVGVMWYFVLHADAINDTRTAEYHLLQGNKLFNRKDYRAAMKEYDEALQTNPKLADAYLNRGLASDQIDSNVSIADYNTALDIDSSNTLALYWRGVAREKLNDYEGAIGDYTAAIHYDSTMAKAYRRRGVARYALHDSVGYSADLRRAAVLGDSIARVEIENVEGHSQ